MADHQVIISGNPCQCGCGGIAKNRFVKGHNAYLQGPEHPGWKGGRNPDGEGYILVKCPDHPRANCSGYVREHILVLEKAFGRPLEKGETPHHRDKNHANNYIGNLILFKTAGMHAAYEARLRAFEECGNYEGRKCRYCHKYDSLDNLAINGSTVYHRPCHNAYGKRRKLSLLNKF